MQAKRRMTPLQFEAIRPLLNIADTRIEAARLVLVEGKTYQAVGSQYGWTKQAVFDAVGVVWKLKARYDLAQAASSDDGHDLPPGWSRATVAAPRAMLERFMSEAAQAALDAGMMVPAPARKPRAAKRAGVAGASQKKCPAKDAGPIKSS